jgi:hypothetical protein
MLTRRSLLASAAGGILVVATTAASYADVKVSYVNPERFSDPDFHNNTTPSERKAILEELARYIERTAAPALKGRNLQVEITDLKLAGDYEPVRTSARIRIQRDTTPPRITLRYQLTGGGVPPRRGQETLTDMNYLSRPEVRYSAGDRLAPSKLLLNDWLLKLTRAG